MKVAITILVILNLILSLLQAQPPQRNGQDHGQHQRPPGPPLFMLLDQNKDGSLSAEEIAAAAELIKQYDSNGDGQVSMMEIVPPPTHHGQGGQQGGHPGPPNAQPGAPQQQSAPRDYYFGE